MVGWMSESWKDVFILKLVNIYMVLVYIFYYAVLLCVFFMDSFYLQ